MSGTSEPCGVEASAFAAALLAWHVCGGRHDLPWQRERTPYRVWISEIMLQQTQVATVIPYFERFMQRFADARALADAPLDDVLHSWAGLGYYARARNLHRAAVRIRDDFNGEFPRRFEDIARLPGIGRSTAGAILALSRGERFPILDGNVRRALSRYFGVQGDPSRRETREQLWRRADECTPQSQVDRYTQAIMDFGATVCTPRKPLCGECPLRGGCFAHRTGRQHQIPARRARRARPVREVFMVVAKRGDGGVLLERRPEGGVWGGLWCLPEFTSEPAARAFIARSLAAARLEVEALGTIEHAFTHFDLTIKPLLAPCEGHAGVMDGERCLWYNPREPARVGLPAPIKTLLGSLAG